MRPDALFLERLETPTGPLLVVTDLGDRLRAVDWEDHAPRLHRLLARHYGETAVQPLAVGRSTAHRALEAYFAGDRTALDAIVTATNGTEFQRAVWAALRKIPLGQAVSYGTLATRIGRPKAVRAVGLANGANPIAIVVPCHRVIGANATLTGYAGGLARKRWLLTYEGAEVARQGVFANA